MHFRLLLTFLISVSILQASSIEKKRENRNLNEIYQKVVEQELTMVSRERFDTIDLLSKVIINEHIDGDVVECGCWRGGMSIYMAYAFPDRQCWVCDSFQGFEPLDHCKHDPKGVVNERHFNGVLVAPEQEVRRSFANMGLNETNGVKFLPGWVNDTTDPKTCSIEKISLLRIDVDAYSATLVTLENLYDKVVPGGFIIFDDTCLYETVTAIEEFEKNRGIEIISKLYEPSGKFLGKLNGEPGMFYQKPRL